MLTCNKTAAPKAGTQSSVAIRSLIACLATIPLVTEANAQATGPTPEDKAAIEANAKSADKLDLDLETPTAPGLVMVGISPKDAADPGNLKDFSVDLASLADGGSIKPGIALSGTPYWWSLFDGDGEGSVKTIDYYRNETTRFERLWARTQVSLGTAEFKGGNNKNGAKIGFGVSTQLLDSQDQKFQKATSNCIHGVWQSRIEPQLVPTLETNLSRRAKQEAVIPPNATRLEKLALYRKKFIELYDEELEKLKVADFKKEKAACLEQAKDRFNAAPSWVVGGGLAAVSDNGKLEDVAYGGASFWSTYKLPITGDGTGAFTFFARGDLDRDFKLKNGGTGEADALLFAVSGVYQSEDLKFDATLSYNYKDYDSPALGDDDFLRYSGTVSVKVREGVWVEATAGAVSNGKFEEEGFGLINLKLGFGD